MPPVSVRVRVSVSFSLRILLTSACADLCDSGPESMYHQNFTNQKISACFACSIVLYPFLKMVVSPIIAIWLVEYTTGNYWPLKKFGRPIST